MVAPPSTPPTATGVLAGRAPRCPGGESADETDLARVSWSPASHQRRSRVPPGQYVTRGLPVLSAGPTPHTPLAEWSFTIHGAVAEPVSWSWGEFPALPSETITTDIHCVTKWSKLDTSWRGVSLDTLLEAVDTSAGYHRVLIRRLQRPGASGRHRRARVGGLRVRRRAACPRARRSGPTAGPAPVLLEERRVGAPADGDRR